MTFQRLHFYGVQLILLIVLTFSWNNTAFQLGDAFIFNGQVTGTVVCGGFTGCPDDQSAQFGVSTLWIVVFWIGYGFFTRNDSASLLRSILHFASFAYGVGLILYGISRAIEFGILALFNVTLSASDILNNYNFASLITLGLLITAVYVLWLRNHCQQRAFRTRVGNHNSYSVRPLLPPCLPLRSGGVLRLYS